MNYKPHYIYLLAFILKFVSVSTKGIEDFDFGNQRLNEKLPKGCYSHNSEVLCFKLGINLAKDHSEAARECELDNGQLALTLPQEIWGQIINNIVQTHAASYSASRFMWLGPKILANSTKLIDVNGQAVDITGDSVWAHLETEQKDYDHCSYAHITTGVIFADGFYKCSHNSSKFYLCEYELQLPCTTKSLDEQLKAAGMEIDNSKTHFNGTERVDENILINIKCKDGLSPGGPSFTVCSRGKWTQFPTCTKVCPLPTPKHHSHLWAPKTHYEIGERALYFCNDGYFAENGHSKEHFINNCTDTGHWEESNTDCIIIPQPKEDDTVTIQIIEDHEPLVLHCSINRPASDGHNITWYRNDIALTQNKNFIVVENGSLLIRNSKSEDVGFYYCLEDSETAHSLIESPQLYHLEYHAPCTVPSVLHYEKVYSEGEFTVLACQAPEPGQFTFTWYKNEHHLPSNETHIVLPSGGLYFKNLGLDDAAVYRCEAVHKAIDCHFNVTHTLLNLNFTTFCASHALVPSHILSSQLLQQPWLAKIWLNDDTMPWCYGTIIHFNWIITTADCVEKLAHVKHSILNVEVGSSHFPVELLKVHPQYERGLLDNDIALIRISDMNSTHNLVPACIVYSLTDVETVDPHAGRISGSVGGWGSLGHQVEKLAFRTEELVVEDAEKCAHRNENFSTDMFCAVAAGSGNSTFAGDSGSPFIVKSNGKVTLIGIFSWGLRRKQKGDHDYFTNVTYHYNWIQSVISV